ncbi:MAG TPA: cytochrome c oxidase subunit II [Burkholderiales bacterium]|nr:cytochrome c oxidase subunit II [Burkholderiales bacterium]
MGAGRIRAAALLVVSPPAWCAPFQSALEPAGQQAARVHDLWTLMLVMCTVVGVAIVVAMLIAVWRAPRASASTPPEAELTRRPEPRLASWVIGSVTASVIGLFVLLVASVVTDRTIARLPLDQAVVIEVTGHQWWWEVRYDNNDPTQIFTTANEMHVPVGKPVMVKLQSSDVIHSLWIPNLAGKKDLIPGHTLTLTFRADKPGTYRSQCAEFCGFQHANMALTVTAESAEEYGRWLQAQLKPAAEPATPEELRGKEVFLGSTCPMCHAVQGTTALARRAPDLTHLASRPTLAAGTVPNTRGHLAGWIVDPHSIKPGVNMPSNTLPPQDLQALLAYLGNLR